MLRIITRSSGRVVPFGTEFDFQSVFSKVTVGKLPYDLFGQGGELSSCIPNTAPPKLYHYTDPFGLDGISRSGQLWVGPARLLNDSSEVSYFAQEVRNAIDSKRSEIAKGRDITPTDLQKLRRLELFLRASATSVFILSLTEMHDQLSQWRAYANNGQGYAIGIPTVALLNAAIEQNFVIAKCSYDRVLAQNTAIRIVNDFFDLIPSSELPDGTKSTPVLNAMRNIVGQIAPLFKHPGFEEEREWRIFQHSPEKDLLHSRPTAQGIIEYAALNWIEHARAEQKNEKGETVTVTAGPGIRDSQGVHRMFQELGLRAGVGQSQIPYST